MENSQKQKLVVEDSLKKHLNPWLHGLAAYPSGITPKYIIEKYGFKEDEVLRLHRNEATIGASPKASAAAKEAVDLAHEYPTVNSLDLIADLSEEFKADGLNMDKLGVVVGNGMDNILHYMSTLFLDKESSIVINSPTFVVYQLSAKFLGADVIDVPRLRVEGDNKLAIDPDAVIAAAQKGSNKGGVSKPCKIVFLCSPNNPTGDLIYIKDIEKIADALDCFVFVDHAYIQFTDDKQDAKYLVEKYPNIIVGYTFSKSYAMAGYRVGYALMAKEVQEKYFQILAPFVTTRPSLAAARAALKDKEHLAKIVEVNNAGKEFFYKELPNTDFEFLKTDANFILVENKKMPIEKLMEGLASKGILVRPMPGVSPYAVRVTIGREAENQRVLKALKELSA